MTKPTLATFTFIALCGLFFSACTPQRLLVGAIVDKNVGKVRLLLNAGTPVNQPYGESQLTPLMAAALVGSPEVTQLLIEHGAEVNARDKSGTTALHVAARTGDCSTIKILVANGAELDGRDAIGVTPLMSAVMIGKPEAMKCLIEIGANVDLQAIGGNTVLMNAVFSGDPAIVQALLDAGADTSLRTECGDTAEDVVMGIKDAGIKDLHTDEILRLLHDHRSATPPSAPRSPDHSNDCGCTE